MQLPLLYLGAGTMRSFSFIALLLLLSSDQCSAAPTFGNDFELPDSSVTGSDFLLGTQINVTPATEITDVGIYFKTDAGLQGQVGIYADDAGAPGALLAQTDPFAISSRRVEVPPISPTILSGDVWFMAVYEENANVAFEDMAGGNVVSSRSLQFGFPLPNPFGSASQFTGQEYSYFLIGVPEPSSFLLAALAAVSLAFSVRRFGRRAR